MTQDLWSQLPIPSWRGIPFPASERTVSRAHDTVEHKIQYRNGFPVEMTGARNWTFDYSLPLREDIELPGYGRLYTELLPALVEAFNDRSPGVLVDPVYGEFVCVPSTWDDSATATIRAGSDVRIQFVHTPEPDDPDLTLDSLASTEVQARSLQQQIEAVDWEEEEPPSLDVDLFGQIAGYGAQLEFAGDRFIGQIERVAFGLEKVESQAEKLEHPERSGVVRSSRRLRLATLKVSERASNPGRTIRTVTTSYAKTISAVATELNMTIEQLLQLNPALGSTPLVPAGTVIRRYI